MPIHLSKSIKILLALFLAVFLVQHVGDQFFGTHLFYELGLSSLQCVSRFKLWQVFTYSFVHRDVMQLVLNSMVLAFVGSELEWTWGTKVFLRYYFTCLVTAAGLYCVCQTLFDADSSLVLIGASSAVYGLLLAYGRVFGSRVMFLMMLFPIQAKYLIWILGGIELLTLVSEPGGALASVGALGGILGGWIYLNTPTVSQFLALRGRLWPQRQKSQLKHLRLVKSFEGSQTRGKSILDPLSDASGDSSGDSEDPEDDKPKLWH